MLMKAAALLLPLALLTLMPESVLAQGDRPLFLDNRPAEDASVIDVTEITEQYAKAAVDEYQKAIAEARKGNRLGAQGHLEAAIRIEPRFFNARNSLAILFHRLAQYDDAEREYLEAAKLNPRSLAPHVNLASLHIEEALSVSDRDGKVARGLLNSALLNLKKAFEIQPSSPLAHYLSGMVYYMTAFYEESESHFKKALASGGDTMIVARLALAEIYIRLKEWDNVVVQLDEYLGEFPLAPNRTRIRSVRNAAAERLTSPSQ